MGKKTKVAHQKAKKRQEKQVLYNSNYFFLILLVILALILFEKMVVEGLRPIASDTLAWRGAANCLLEYREKTGHLGLWDTNIFSGMPAYMISYPLIIPNLDTIIALLGNILSRHFVLLLLAGFSLFYLLRYLKMPPIIALLGSCVFIFTPHFYSLIEAGHNTKFYSIMYTPLIFFTFIHLLERRNLLAYACFTLTITLQLRANHPQIIYYTWLALVIYWIFTVIMWIRQRQYKLILVSLVLGVLAVALALVIVAQPYWPNYEYAHYTIRGGSGPGAGLSKDYAMNWSFHPLEMLTFLIPGFFGLRDTTYWGWMPFTSTSMYMGLIPLILALIAIIYYRKPMVWYLLTLSVFSLLISFGKYLSPLADFMLNYFPYYNKFRSPSMILVLLQFAIAILSGYGLFYLIQQHETRWQNRLPSQVEKFLLRTMLIVSGILILVLISRSALFQMLKSSWFIKNGEPARYAPRVIEYLQQQRFAIFHRDLLRFLIILLAFVALTFTYLKAKLSNWGFAGLLILITIVDLWSIDFKYFRNMEKPQEIESSQFAKTSTDQFLLRDPTLFRIFPVGQEFSSNRWCYYHQSIGGYHAAKLKVYQQIIENCLYRGPDPQVPINWNVVNMLNVKYLLAKGYLPVEHLRLVHTDSQEKLLTYENRNVFPRAWLVGSYEVISDPKSIWTKLNSSDFDFRHRAILEKPLPEEIAPPDSQQVEIIEYDLHRIKISAYADKPALLVLSEIYYPAGWQARVDDYPTEIYKTNYMLRSVYLPAGTHTVEFYFAPKSHYYGIRLSTVGTIVLAMLFGVAGVRYRSTIWRVLKKNK